MDFMSARLAVDMPQGRIRIAIADDHKLFVEGLTLILKQEGKLELVGCAANGLEAIDMVGAVKPDVLLLEITMPEMDGISILPSIREKSPATRVLMLTGASAEEIVFKALKRGARGYVTKNASASNLIKAINAVYDGEMWLERKFITCLLEKEFCGNFGKEEDPSVKAKTSLTKREQEVLRLLTKGESNKSIAKELFISEKTVKSHLNSIFKKLNVSRRLPAIIQAIKAGIC